MAPLLAAVALVMPAAPRVTPRAVVAMTMTVLRRRAGRPGTSDMSSCGFIGSSLPRCGECEAGRERGCRGCGGCRDQRGLSPRHGSPPGTECRQRAELRIPDADRADCAGAYRRSSVSTAPAPFRKVLN